jgi:putative Mn2+ efflux pump MntP
MLGSQRLPWCGRRLGWQDRWYACALVGPRRHAFVRARPKTKIPMNFLATAALAFAMSTDAFAVAIGKGAALQRPHVKEALRTGAIFGVIEGLTPLIGWALGQAAAPYLEAWDHWIAFVLLGFLGLRMLREALIGEDVEEEDKPVRHSFWLLALTGFATSIDAMAVGVGLAFMDADILSTAAAIGFCTFMMVTLGVMLGRALGRVVGKRAELAGGVVLIAIGSMILYQHLAAV